MDRADRYPSGMIMLHWLTALLIAAAWLGAQTIDMFPRELRPSARSVHMLIGIAAGLVLCIRLVERYRRRGAVPAQEPGLLGLAASAVHVLLYVLVAAVVVVGLVNAWARGETMFGLFSMAPFPPPDRALRQTIGGLHELAANAILILAGLHAAAALAHHYVLRDQVLRRMLPSR